MKAPENPHSEAFSEVAITGYAVRLPQAENVAAFWQVLTEQKCIISEIGADRFSKEMFYHPDPSAKGKTYTMAAGQLENIWKFDPGYFGISPREARQMDPQQRLLLEVTAEAIAEAGLTNSNWDRERTGVYVGASSSDFSTGFAGDPDAIDAQFMVGNTLSIISNRLAYVFDIKGPSYTVDTACSSSFFAMDQAVAALQSGKIDTAIVGAVNLLISPIPFVGFSRASMLSADGLCKAFDQSANGYVRSEGAVVFVLRRMDIARENRDHARAIIHAAAVNSDGRTVGLSMPSSRRQQELLEDIRKQNPFDLNDLAFIEAHGTGTAVGDPVEANAIGNAFGKTRGAALPIGSAKSNFGHLEPASGLVGLLKSVLSLEKGIYPASLHITEPNPHIDFKALNISLAKGPVSLPERNRPWLAGINSFGFGGANAHIVLRQLWDHEKQQMPDIAPRNRNLVLSAASDAGLRQLAAQYCAQVLDKPAAAFHINNANFRREHQNHRLVALGADLPEIRASLEAYLKEESPKNLITGESKSRNGKVGFVFSGNGAQWPGMGRHLYQSNVDFRRVFQRVAKLYRKKTGVDLAALLFDQDFEQELGKSPLVQPLVFAIQVALCDSLAEAGLRPDSVVGHSAGEVTAAYCAGILSLQSAVDLVYSRSSALAEIYGLGGMAAVLTGAGPLSEALAEFGDKGVVISADNSTRSTSISGPIDALKEFAKFARKRRVAVKILDIAYPFHSPFVETIKNRLLSDLTKIQPQAGHCAYYSSTLGRCVDGTELDAEYWWKNTRNMVQFRQATGAMAADGCEIIVEISPKGILRNYVMDSQEDGQSVDFVSTLGPGKDKDLGVEEIVAKTFVLGADVDYLRFHGAEAAYFGGLPLVPWQHNDFCRPISPNKVDIYGDVTDPPLLGHRVRASEGAWHNRIDPINTPWLKDHVVDGSVVFPATGFVEMALAAGKAEFGSAMVEITDMQFLRPVVLAGDAAIDMRTSFEPSSNLLRIDARKADTNTQWEPACFCTLRLNPKAQPQHFDKIDGAEQELLYDDLAETGLQYGPEFALVRRIHLAGNQALSELAIPREKHGFLLDPRGADAAMHGLFALINAATENSLPSGTIMVPASFGRVLLFEHVAEICTAHIRLTSLNEHGLSADIHLCNFAGDICASLTEVRLRAIVLAKNTALTPMWQQEMTKLSAPDTAPDIMEIIEKLALTGEDIALSDAAILMDTAARSLAFREILALAGDSRITQTEVPNFALAQSCLEILEEDGLATRGDGADWLIHPEKAFPDYDVLLIALLKNAPHYAVEIQDLIKLNTSLGPALQAGLTELDIKPEATNTRHAERWKWQAAHQILDQVISEYPSGKRLNILVIGQPSPQFYEGFAAKNIVDRLVITDMIDSNVARHKQHRKYFAKADFLTISEIKALPEFDLMISVDGLIDASAAHLNDVSQMLAAKGKMLVINETETALGRLLRAQDLAYWDEKSLKAMMPVARHEIGGVLPEKLANAGFFGLNTIRLGCDLAEISVIVAAGSPQECVQTPLPEFRIWPESTPEILIALSEEIAVSQKDDIAGENIVFGGDIGDCSDGVAGFLQACKNICSQKPASLVFCSAQECTTLRGIGAVLVNEYPDIEIRTLECDGLHDISTAMRATKNHPKEPHLIWRKGNIFAPRIQKTEPVVVQKTCGDALRLRQSQQGSFDALRWQPIARRAPSAGEVELEVLATGLNFRDVMWALGMLPAEALENGFAGAGLGMECVGKVLRAGDDCGFDVGDRVLGFAPFAFSSHVTLDARVLGKVPEGMMPETAAALPVAFMTALYGLEQVGQLQKDEVVLIHGGAGGVGMAALQIAKDIGARVIATAGTKEKRQLLRDLGATWVLDSRSMQFAEEVQALSGGVDVVLNALAGEAMERSIACLKPFGRFVELGKRDFYANTRIGLRPFRKNISYFGVDVDQLLTARPNMVAQLFQKLNEGFESGKYAPPPCQIFAANEAADAFRLMQKSGHIGKIIIQAPKSVALPQIKEFEARDAWLIIGGTSGVGLAMAQFLAQRGAKKLWLVSRSGVADIGHIDAEVEIVQCDATDPTQMQDLFEKIAKDSCPLRGVIHGAMVLDDGFLADQTPQRMLPVLRAKMTIGTLLDKFTKGLSLDHFVVLSSISTFFGNPGQVAYVAGNAFLEGLVQQRRARGAVGNCIAFGPIGDVGYLADKAGHRAIMEKQIGGRIMDIETALHGLADILAQNPPYTIAIGAMGWANMVKDLALLDSPYFDRIDLSAKNETRHGGVDLMALVAGLSEADALIKAVELLREETAKVLLQPAQDIDPDKPLTDLGFDSLMAMALRMQAEENLGINLPLMALVDGLTLKQLAFKVLRGDAQESIENQLISQHVNDTEIAPEIIENIGNIAQNMTSLTQKNTA